MHTLNPTLLDIPTNTQGSLQEAMREKARIEDAYTSASASLNILRHRTQLLREENNAFMASYDSHLEKLVSGAQLGRGGYGLVCTPGGGAVLCAASSVCAIVQAGW